MKCLPVFILLCLTVLVLTGCSEEVLTVVTSDKSGKKVVHNYTSVYSHTIYDEDISHESWQDILYESDDLVEEEDLIFYIENKKEDVIVLGDRFTAFEIAFFEGGCVYTTFYTTDFSDILEDL